MIVPGRADVVMQAVLALGFRVEAEAGQCLDIAALVGGRDEFLAHERVLAWRHDRRPKRRHGLGNVRFGRPAPGRAPPLAIRVPLRRFKKSPSMTQAADENSSGLPCHAERVCVVCNRSNAIRPRRR
jgi:hypothetical protein